MSLTTSDVTDDAFTTDLDRALADLQAETKRINEANGWHDGERRFDAGIGLLHSEISEALEAFRDHGLEDVTAVYTGHAAEHPEGLPPVKPEGVGSELADVLIRLLDETERMGFVPVRSLMAKLWGPAREDFASMIPVLHEDVSRIFRAGRDAQAKRDTTPAYGLANLPDNQKVQGGHFAVLLGHLADAADIYGIDLLAETRRKLAFNATRGYRHGGKRV